MADTSQKIVVEFDGVITSNPYDPSQYFEPIAYGTDNLVLNKIVTASSVYSTSYPVTNIRDGSTSAYWRPSTNANQWVKVDLKVAQWVGKLKFYVSSYMLKDFILAGSNDDVTYTTVYSGTSDNTAGWKEFTFTPAKYRYWRLSITNAYSTYIYLYEYELYEVLGNQNAFAVSTQEYDHLNGTIQTVTHRVINVSYYGDMTKLLLTIDPYQRFKNAEGIITVSYDQSKGNLRGVSGTIESFQGTFTPTGLIQAQNPYDRENLSTGITNLDVHVHQVTYKDGYNTDRLSAGILNLSIVVTFVGTQNP